MKTIEELKNKVIQGDCLKVMKKIPDKSIDLILQDPPYNTTICKWEWDIMTKIDEFWAEWKRIIKDNGAIIMTAIQPFTSKLVISNLKWFRYEWIWEKNPTGFLNAKKMPLRNIENILVFYKRLPIYNPQNLKKIKPKRCKNSKSKQKRIGTRGLATHNGGRLKEEYIQEYTGYPSQIIKVPSETGLHPTQKPVALFEFLIKTYTNEGDMVFDGFAGSGTTGVACKNLNRNFICVELDKKYAKIAQQRIDNL